MLKAQKVTEYVYETKVSNSSAKAVEVLIKDQIPVSTEKDIVVDVVNIDGALLDKETGFLSKKVNVEAGGNASLRISYKVAWPKDKRISESRKSFRVCPSCGMTTDLRFCPNCGTNLR